MFRLSTLGGLGLVAAAVGLAACASAGGAAGTGGRRSSCPLRERDSVFLAGGPVYRSCAVDRQAAEVGHLTPDFRPSPGRDCYSAEVDFVVGASGRPEDGTERIVQSNDRDFAEAVRALVPRLRFTPATRDGSAVRQIVEYKQAAMTRVQLSGSPPPAPPATPRC